jgi:hypothetical protein
MSMEDLNIFMYIKDFGTNNLKRPEFWEQGYDNFLWRSNKTVASLRSRLRFYVSFLKKHDIKLIKEHIRENPKTPCFNNFITLKDNVKKLMSITNDNPDQITH